MHPFRQDADNLTKAVGSGKVRAPPRCKTPEPDATHYKIYGETSAVDDVNRKRQTGSVQLELLPNA